jgi:hypothetical protein
MEGEKRTVPIQHHSSGQGAYGFDLLGFEEDSPLLGPAEPGWPSLRVVRATPDPDHSPRSATPGTVAFDEERGEVWIGDGERVVVDRTTMTVRVITERRVDDRLMVHPYLGLPAAWASRWLGRQVLHGGAFVHSGRAWAVLGNKEGGKSSTLAWLLRRGHEIVSDDILVIEEGTVFSGPRCVDLRSGAASRLGGEDIGKVGARVRWRLSAGPVAPSMPLAGLVHLSWGDRVLLEPLTAEHRLAGLVEHSAISPEAGDSVAYLDLAVLPAWRFVRPQGWEAFEQANTELLEVLG